MGLQLCMEINSTAVLLLPPTALCLHRLLLSLSPIIPSLPPRHLMGEAIGALPPKELKSLEGKLQNRLSRVRSKKNELLFAEIEYMRKREIDLHNSNQYLRAKINENERAQQQMSLMPGAAGSSGQYREVGQPDESFDARKYLQVNGLQPNNANYPSHQDHQTQHVLIQLMYVPTKMGK